jgi:hypothetical protein
LCNGWNGSPISASRRLLNSSVSNICLPASSLVAGRPPKLAGISGARGHMKGVSTRIINVVATAVVVVAIAVQPVFAAANMPAKGSHFESLIRKIIRALDTIDIRFPTG